MAYVAANPTSYVNYLNDQRSHSLKRSLNVIIVKYVLTFYSHMILEETPPTFGSYHLVILFNHPILHIQYDKRNVPGFVIHIKIC